MREDNHKRIVDITGVEITPGEPSACLGNGEQGFECCCDECDYYLLCFSEFDSENREENIDMDKFKFEPHRASAEFVLSNSCS